MFELPSIWNIVVSTVVFFVAAWYFSRFLKDQGLPGGMTRSVSVFVLAYLVSWGSGEIVDWMQGPQSKTENPQDVSRLLNQLGGTQP